MKKTIRKIGYVLAGVMLSGALALTGCRSLKQENTTADTWEETLANWKESSPKEIEDHIKLEVSEHYRIDADIQISEELENYEVTNIRLARHIYEDEVSVLKEWLEYCGVTSYSEITEGEDTGLEQNKMIGYAMTDLSEDGQEWVQVRSNYALMTTALGEKYGTLGLTRMYDTQHAGWFDYASAIEPVEKEILSEEKIEDIKEHVESIFEVEFMEKHTVYTYTEERLKEIAEYVYAHDEALGVETVPEEVTEDDEGVVITFSQGYNGIPLSFLDVSRQETGANWSVENNFVLICSKTGIKYLDIMNPYDILGEAEQAKILSFGEMIEKHMELRGGVDTTVVDVGLYYLPIYTGEDLNFVTKPVWYIRTEEIQKNGYPYRVGSIYDAVTGEELML